MRKFKRAVTDSEAEVAFRDGKDGVNNLMGIYSAFTGKSLEKITEEFAGKGYGDFKTAVGEAVVEELRPVRERFDELMKNRDFLTETWRKGAENAEKLANRTLSKVMKKIGFIY